MTRQCMQGEEETFSQLCTGPTVQTIKCNQQTCRKLYSQTDFIIEFHNEIIFILK